MWGGYAQGTYTVSKDETFTAGKEINTVDNIIMVLGSSGTYSSGKKRANYVDEDFQYYTQANNGIYNENAEPGGGYFIFKTAKKGSLTIGVDVNKGKRLVLQDANFDVINDFTYNLPSTAGGESQVLDANKGVEANSYGTITFKVSENGTYYLVLQGSKLGVQGFKYTTTETLTIAASGYTTYTASYPVNYSANNLTAYAVKYSAGTISYNEIKGVVPAKTPVLVAGTASQKYELAKAETDGKTVDTDLKAADGSTIKGDGTIYGFGTKNDVSGFRRVADGVVVPAKKAYLVINDAANSKEFFAFDGETTGISTIETTTAKTENGVAYSLSGQRVGDSYKGIVIINGKKVVRK